ncbi:MAG: hypothetical protein QW728_00375 [Thermoplasmata archaeon]
MRTVFVGAGACFANIMTDFLNKVEKYRNTSTMWRLLGEVVKYEGTGTKVPQGKYDVYYFDSGPELAREERRGRMFTYSVAPGALLSGAGNVRSAKEFWEQKGSDAFSKMMNDFGEPVPDLYISIRGCGSTNCGSGFSLDRTLLDSIPHAVILQFLILPHRGEGIDASRVIYAMTQAVDLLKKYPDRYTCVLISNEAILTAAKSFEEEGQNWFYPVANKVVADIVARVLFPTFFEHHRHIVEKVKDGPQDLGYDSREKYLDVRDFIRQPGFKTVGFAHKMTVDKVTENDLNELSQKMEEGVKLIKYEDGEPLIFGLLGKMENASVVFSMILGPRGKVGDMTKVALAEYIEDNFAGAFPKVYVYDILQKGLEVLIFPSGGTPLDFEIWGERFLKKLANPRYSAVVEQYTTNVHEITRYYRDLTDYFMITKPHLLLKD